MMYGNHVAVAIKANGKVLREFKDTVYIPFSSEYTILLKNLNTKRAIFNIFIDGDNVVPGGLVLNGGQEIELERAIRNGNLNEGNRFKFIERTSSIEEYRGIKLEDGLVRIEYQFEKIRPYYSHNFLPGRPVGARYDFNTSDILCSASPAMNSASMSKGGTRSTKSAVPQNDAGITVPGSKSEQKFTTVSGFEVESEKHSLIIRLLGETEDNKPVVAPVVVSTKISCSICNRKNKATAKFCSSCGTSLVIFS